MKTGIITTDSYLNHETGQGHPERADRVSVIIENKDESIAPKRKNMWSLRADSLYTAPCDKAKSTPHP